MLLLAIAYAEIIIFLSKLQLLKFYLKYTMPWYKSYLVKEVWVFGVGRLRVVWFFLWSRIVDLGYKHVQPHVYLSQKMY